MSQVKLMNRSDHKFWFSYELLHDMLRCIKNDYYILSINNQVLLPYKTTYYDTLKNDMYVAHHNGKLNRYKIRRRSYIINDISFLEVKFKNNKGRTIKNRIQTNTSNHHFSKKEAEFIREYSPFTCEELTPSLQNKFNRITLVAKNFNERCTIDTNLLFELSESKVDLNNLVVLEIKSDGRLDNSPFENTLKDYRIRSSGFSKYCIGRTIIDPYVKKNAFKKKLRSIEKVLHA
jgi:hypothetical protein